MRLEWHKVIIKRFFEYLKESKKKTSIGSDFIRKILLSFLLSQVFCFWVLFLNMPYLIWRRSFDYFVRRMSEKVSETKKNFYFLLLSTFLLCIIYFILIFSFTLLDLVIPRGFCPCEATGNDVVSTLSINMCYTRPL